MIMTTLMLWFTRLPPWAQRAGVRASRTALQSFVAVAGTTLGAATIGPSMPWSSMMTVLYGLGIAVLIGVLSGVVSFAQNALESWSAASEGTVT